MQIPTASWVPSQQLAHDKPINSSELADIFTQLRASPLSYVRAIAKHLQGQGMLFLQNDNNNNVDDIPEVFTQLNLGFPLIIPVRECGDGEPPKTEHLFHLCLDLRVNSTAQVYDDSEGMYKCSDLAKVLAQLVEPDPQKPKHACNLRPPDSNRLQTETIVPSMSDCARKIPSLA